MNDSSFCFNKLTNWKINQKETIKVPIENTKEFTIPKTGNIKAVTAVAIVQIKVVYLICFELYMLVNDG